MYYVNQFYIERSIVSFIAFHICLDSWSQLFCQQVTTDNTEIKFLESQPCLWPCPLQWLLFMLTQLMLQQNTSFLSLMWYSRPWVLILLFSAWTFQLPQTFPLIKYSLKQHNIIQILVQHLALAGFVLAFLDRNSTI